MQFDELLTEQRNHRSTHIDREYGFPITSYFFWDVAQFW